MNDDPARTGAKKKSAAVVSPEEATTPSRTRTPLISVVLRQLGILAGGALAAQGTWGTPWFAAVVVVVVLLEGFVVWDWRHPRRG